MTIPTKFSLENITSLHLSYIAIIYCFNLSKLYRNGELPGAKFVGKVFKLRKRMKNSLSCIPILHKTFNLNISCCGFAEDGKETCQI